MAQSRIVNSAPGNPGVLRRAERQWPGRVEAVHNMAAFFLDSVEDCDIGDGQVLDRDLRAERRLGEMPSGCLSSSGVFGRGPVTNVRAPGSLVFSLMFRFNSLNRTAARLTA